jgi:SAM-dependent methyltransferase
MFSKMAGKLFFPFLGQVSSALTPLAPPRLGFTSAQGYTQKRVAHWEGEADHMPRMLSHFYQKRVRKTLEFLVPPGLKVLELGCGRGDLLAAVRSSQGVGVDFSPSMIAQAKERHPSLRFVQADAHQVPLDESFDVIIASDLINDLWDVQAVLEEIRRLSHAHTRVILNFYNRLWQPLFRVSQALGLTQPNLPQNWLSYPDVANLLSLAGFEVVRHWEEILCSLPLPFLERLCNRYLVRTWPLNKLALSNFVVARTSPRQADARSIKTVSVIVPARNEAGNIPAIFRRLPKMGQETEIIFVEGHSKDNTFATIAGEIQKHPQWSCQLLQQTGVGKGDAVRLGFAQARGDVVMILDADLTVCPEDLPRFFHALQNGHGEFINGVRLVYPMEQGAMRFFNFLGNKFFSSSFSWLLGQPIKDTLCGTKALTRQHYELISRNRAYFGDFDPFGDFDLIFGAAKLNLKIVDLPIRYRERTYGTTNIQRWKHGWLLLRMLGKAARRIKFR